MRTTLTLAPDVAARIEAIRRKEGMTLRDLINAALRRGLTELEKPARKRPFRTQSASLQPRTTHLDDIAEMLAVAEGDGFR